MTIRILYITVILLIVFKSELLFSQCSCIGGASVGSLTPVSGTSNIGILKEGNIRALAFYSFSNGDKYYSGNTAIDSGTVKEFNSSYSGILIGYGLFDSFTLDLELGYFLNKSQDFGEYTLSGAGFSHLTIYEKYNIFNSRAKEWEWTVGLGEKIPINNNSQNLPQNIQSSTGAFGLILLSYLHKGYRESGLHLILVNRAEFNTENGSNYLYGNSFTNSFFITKSIFDKLVGMLEIRSELKLKDKRYDEKVDDSGWNNITLSPQINYSFDKFDFSFFFDLPVYKYYNGQQLTNKFNLGLSITWQMNLLKLF